MERKDLDEEIGFIVRHYKTGLFNTKKALRKIKPSIRKAWSWQKIAAASSILFVIGASAAFLIRNNLNSETQVEIENTVSTEVPFETVSRVIDFDDTPLPIVINQINLVFDVVITNIPDNADDYRISLHYEVNAIDLIETINEILGINLEIEK